MALAEAPYHGRFFFPVFFWSGVSIASLAHHLEF